MTITTICPGCRTPWHVEPSLRGQRMRCPNGSCREVFEVREAPAAAPPTPTNSPRPVEPAVSPATPVRPGAMTGSVGEMVPILSAEQVGGPPVKAPAGRPAPPAGRAPIPMAEVVESPPLPPPAPPTWRQAPPPVRRAENDPVAAPPVPATSNENLRQPVPPAPPNDWRSQPPPPRQPEVERKPLPPPRPPAAPEPPPPPRMPPEPAVETPAVPVELPPGAWEAPPVRQPAGAAIPETVAQESTTAPVSTARRRARWFMAGITIGVVVVLGVGLLIIWRLASQTEEKLAQAAGQAYAENRFGTAAAKYRELTEKYHESPHSDEYRFMIELSEFRDQVDNASDGLQGELKRVVQFHKEHEKSPFFQPRGREVGDTSSRLLLRCAAKVKEQGDAKALALADEAQQTLSEIDRTNPEGIHAEERKKIETALAEARVAVALNEQHRHFVKRLEEFAADPAVAAFKKAQRLIEQEGKAHPDWRADATPIVEKLKEGILARVTYTDEPAEVGKSLAAEDDERCWLVSPPVRLVRGSPPGRDDQVVFALARGILYALRQSDGEVKWFTRVGVDTTVLPVHVPAAGTRKEMVLVTSADAATLTARDAQTGEQIWQRRLSAPCLGRPVLLEERIYAPTYDGQVHEFELASGKFLGRYHLGKDVHVSLGATREDGTNRLYVAADDYCVYILDVGKLATDRKKTPCEKIVYSGHPNGSLRSAPLLVNEGTHSYLILAQADGLDRCRLRVFKVQSNPFAVPDAPLELRAEVRGWPWFQPYCDGDKLALVTDAGVFSLFGIQQPGNLDDRALFPEISQELAPDGTGPDAPQSERALVAHGEADTFWILARGRLHKRSLAFHQQLGPQLIDRWPQLGSDQSLRLGAPLHASQVWRRPSLADDGGDVVFLVTQLSTGQSCWATAVDAATGKILWQRQLGLMPEGDPLVMDREVLALDQAGGLFSFDSRFDDGDQPAGQKDSQWLASSDSAAKPFLEGSSDPPHLLRGWNGSAYGLGFTGQKTHLVVRHYRSGQEGKRYEVNAVELDLRFPLAGTPGVTQDCLLLPLADGIVWRLPLPLKEGQEAVPGLSWRGSRGEAESGGHIVGIGGSEFLATNGNRGLTRWTWSADKFMSTVPAGGKVPTVSLPARITAAPAVLRPATDPAGLQVCVADARGTLTLLGSDLKPVLSWDLGGKLTAGPFVQSGHIGCVVDRRRLLWFDPAQDQRPLWEYRSAGQGIVGQPQLVEDLVVVADQSGLFVGLDPITGQKRGEGYRLKANVAPAATPVTFGKDRAFAPLTDGTVLLLPLRQLRKPS